MNIQKDRDRCSSHDVNNIGTPKKRHKFSAIKLLMFFLIYLWQYWSFPFTFKSEKDGQLWERSHDEIMYTYRLIQKKNEAKRLGRAMTILGEIECSPILLSQYWKNKELVH